MDWLAAEIRRASVGDLQRAAQFLQFAREVRSGCSQQRRSNRKAQSGAWRKHVDDSVTW